MALKPEKTPVIFRRDPKSEGGNVVAIFPRDPGTIDPHTCSMYQHFGQHCSGRPDLVIRKTKPAYLHEKDVLDLKRELENYGPPDCGYDLVIKKRHTQADMESRRKQIEERMKQ